MHELLTASTLLALTLPTAAQELGLTTTSASGNGQSGNVFGLAAAEGLVLRRVDGNIDVGATTVEAWWTPVPLALDLPIGAGQSVGLYVTTSTTQMNSTDGTQEGAPFVSNAAPLALTR